MLKFQILFGAFLFLQAKVSAQTENCPDSRYLAWTRWFDRDDPSFTGDYETLNDLRKEGNTICPNPIATECQTLTGIPAALTGQIVISNPAVGCYCVNADQPDKICNYDYRVRFGCFSECPQGKFPYWTSWFDRDDQTGDGDRETLSDLIKQGKIICEKPIGNDCETVNGVPASETGELIVSSPSVGCYCLHESQSDKICNNDYRVRFKCCR